MVTNVLQVDTTTDGLETKQGLTTELNLHTWHSSVTPTSTFMRILYYINSILQVFVLIYVLVLPNASLAHYLLYNYIRKKKEERMFSFIEPARYDAHTNSLKGKNSP